MTTKSAPRPAPQPADEPGSALEEVLTYKSAEEIMHPENNPLIYRMTDRAGETYEFEILPMVEDSLIVLSDSLERIIGLFDRIGADDDLPAFDDPEFGPVLIKKLLPKMPQVIGILLPHSARLIAATFNQDLDWVKENFTLPMRFEVLNLIMQAEDIGALLKTLGALVATFQKVSRPVAP